MKTVHAFLGGLLILNASCITIQHTPGKSYSDDVYYSSKDKRTEPAPAPAVVKPHTAENTARTESPEPQTSQPATTDQYKDDQGNTYITNNYNDNNTFDYDDYYDYQYASRLRRFHNPYSGYGYYDGYYTNSYWYSYNPYHWGVSIYSGYHWWGPSYMTYSYYPSWYWNNSWCGVGWGWGHHWPYSGYHHGYRNGYWAGYWDGYYDNYYHNSYDKNSNHYGPRQGIKSNGEVVQKSDFRQKYRDAMALDYKPATPKIAGPGEEKGGDGRDLPVTTIKPATAPNANTPVSTVSPLENGGSNTPAGKNPGHTPVQPTKGGSTKPADPVVVSPNDNNPGTSPGGSTKPTPATVVPRNDNVMPSGGGNTKEPVRVNPPKDNTVTPARNENPAPRPRPQYNSTPKSSEVDVPRQQTPAPAPSRPAYNESRSSGGETRPAPQRSEQRTYTPSNSGGSRSSGGGSNSGGDAPRRRK